MILYDSRDTDDVSPREFGSMPKKDIIKQTVNRIGLVAFSFLDKDPNLYQQYMQEVLFGFCHVFPY